MPRTAQNADQDSRDYKPSPYQPADQSLKDRRLDPLATSFRGPIHSNPSSNLQVSSTDVMMHEGIKQTYVETALTEEIYSDLVLQSLPSTSQAVKQSIEQDTYHFSTSGNTPIVTTDQQNINSGRTEAMDPGLYLHQPTTRVATMFEKATNVSIENAPITNIGHQEVNNYQHVNNHGNYASQILDNLKEFVSFTALHDSSAQDPERCCHPSTRKNVLHKMHTWMDDPNAQERILWLHGPAGVGKSAITQTISYSYGRDKVGASFFFFRSDPIRNDGNRLFPTLAWRLALGTFKVGRIHFRFRF